MSENIKRIAIVGPECTGKTSLSKTLAHHYLSSFVPEFARQFLDSLGRDYNQNDLLTIAKGQLTSEDDFASQTNKILICDTNLIVIKVWSEFKYGNCDPEILQLLRSRHYDLHLLTRVDMPWENDPLREHPHQREELFDIYKSELEQLNVPYIEISGDMNSRTMQAIQAIDKIIGL